MSLLVVGSIAFDSVQTPFGTSEEMLGGSATYFSFAANFLTDVNLVGVVGDDFPDEYKQWFENSGINLEGLETHEGKTFRWSGKYLDDMNTRETLDVQLNVFGEFDPKIPDSFKDSPFVFLANGHPDLQKKVLEQVTSPKLVFADTMNLWIDTSKDSLLNLLQKIDGLIINDEEALQLTGEHLIVKAGKKILQLGPNIVVIKKGEHGALLFNQKNIFAIPAWPLEEVLDPTGAGDSFAGGFMGYLAREGKFSDDTLKRALIYGTVLASYNVEAFGVKRLREISKEDIETRAKKFIDMLNVN